MMSLTRNGKILNVTHFSRAAEVSGLLVHNGQDQQLQWSSVRAFSSKGRKVPFKPRRRPDEKYRPIVIRPKKLKDWSPGNDEKYVDLSKVTDTTTGLDDTIAPIQAADLRGFKQQLALRSKNVDLVEEDLRLMDYLTSKSGSAEDLMYERRFLKQAFDTEEERQEFLRSIENFIEEETDKDFMSDIEPFPVKKAEIKAAALKSLEFGDDADSDDDVEIEDLSDDEDGEKIELDPNQRAFGAWGDLVVSAGRTTKLWRGGRLERYRALVVGGNLNGCGGFGVGKALDPQDAVNLAARMAKRNIFFIDRYQNDGLTRDLVGKQNSCIVTLRATDNGLRGNQLCQEILLRFGITNCVAKVHGNRNPYNVVQATFKAILSHESVEDIALKRGKRIIGVERARRLQV